MRIAALLLACAGPAAAQPMDPHMHMPGMAMPALSAPPAVSPDPHAGHAMPWAEAPAAATAGNAPAPAPVAADYADRVWGADAMAGPRARMKAEHGGMRTARLRIDEAEIRVRDGRNGYRWNGEARFGGDIDAFMIRSEGAGDRGRAPGEAEVQALWSHAIDPYFDVQAGIRHDFRPDPERSYATIGVEGIAPYWFDVEAALFLSDHGDLLGRIEASNDQRITQALILQPRAELNFAAQDVRATGTGRGLSEAELGLRLRYEITRQFAPYIGVSWDRKLGHTARFARRDGESVGGPGFVIGVRAWF
jgi:copper resistance protein B